MEAMKKSTGYAESQIRLLLSDLRTGSQSAKEKALKRFRDYIDTYKPNVCDDDAELLLVGARQGNNRVNGLMHFCGLDSSEKHKGGLKRITKDCIQLLKWLLTLKYPSPDEDEVDEDEEQSNIFYFMFVHLEKDAYKGLNLTKHVQHHDNKDSDRGGSMQDACEIIQILLADHRVFGEEDDESDPLELEDLLENNHACIEVYNVWRKKAEADHVTKMLDQFNKAKLKAAAKIIRPSCWDDVVFTPVPKQEGEEGAVSKIVENEADKVIPDPLGILDIDIRQNQQLYATGKIVPAKNDMSGISSFNKKMDKMKKGGIAVPALGESDDDSSNNESESDEDNWQETSANTRGRRFSLHELEKSGASVGGSSESHYARDRRTLASNMGETRGRRTSALPSPTKAALFKPVKDSCLPKDKHFSAGLFLSLVHGQASFQDLSVGLNNLEKLLGVHGSQRESLVRSHYGLFVQCAQGLDWLKGFRKNVDKSYEASFEKASSSSSSTAGGAVGGGGGNMANVGRRTISVSKLPDKSADVTLAAAERSLETAKLNANLTLEPILKGMKNMTRLKNTLKIIKKSESTLDLPIKMKKAWEKSDLGEFFNYFNKIMTLPSANSGGTQRDIVLASGSSFRLLQKVRALADQIIVNIRLQALSVLNYPCFDISRDKFRDVLKSFSDSESDSDSDGDNNKKQNGRHKSRKNEDNKLPSTKGADDEEKEEEDIRRGRRQDDKTALEAIDVSNYYAIGYERLLPYFKLLLAVDAKVNLDEAAYSPAVSAIIQKVFHSQCFYFVSVVKSLVNDLMDDLIVASVNGMEKNRKVQAQSAEKNILDDSLSGAGRVAGAGKGSRRTSTFGKRRVSFTGAGTIEEEEDENSGTRVDISRVLQESVNGVGLGNLDSEGEQFNYESSSAIFDDCLDDLFLPDYYFTNGPEIWDLETLSPQEKKSLASLSFSSKKQVDYMVILSQRIRIMYSIKFCQAITQWLPVLHRLCRDYQVSVDKQSAAQSSHNNLLRHAASSPPSSASAAASSLFQQPTRVLPQIVALVGEIVVQCVQGLHSVPSSSFLTSSFINKGDSNIRNKQRSGSMDSFNTEDETGAQNDNDRNMRCIFDICDLMAAMVISPAESKEVKDFFGAGGIPLPKPTSSCPDTPKKRNAQLSSPRDNMDFVELLNSPFTKQPLDEDNYNSLVFEVSRIYEAIEEIVLTSKHEDILGVGGKKANASANKYDKSNSGAKSSESKQQQGSGAAGSGRGTSSQGYNNINNNDNSNSSSSSTAAVAAADPRKGAGMFSVLLGAGSKSTSNTTGGMGGGSSSASLSAQGGHALTSKGNGSGVGGSSPADYHSDQLFKLDSRKRLTKGSLYYNQMATWRNLSNESDIQITRRLSSLFLSIVRILPTQSDSSGSGSSGSGVSRIGDSTSSFSSSSSSLDKIEKEKRYILDPGLFGPSSSSSSSSTSSSSSSYNGIQVSAARKKQQRLVLGSFEVVTSSFYYWCLLFLQKVSSSVANCWAVSSDVAMTIKTGFFSLTRSLEFDFAKVSSNENSSSSSSSSMSRKELLSMRRPLDASGHHIGGSSGGGKNGDEIDLLALDASMSSFQSSLFERLANTDGTASSGSGSSNSSGGSSGQRGGATPDVKKRGGPVISATSNQSKNVGSTSTTLLSFYYDILRSIILIRSHIIPVVSSNMLFKFPSISNDKDKSRALLDIREEGPDSIKEIGSSSSASLNRDSKESSTSPSSSFFEKIFSGAKKNDANGGGGGAERGGEGVGSKDAIEGGRKDSALTSLHSKLLTIYQSDEELWSISSIVYEDTLKLEELIFNAIIANFTTQIRNVLFTSYSNSLKRLYTIDSATTAEGKNTILSPVHLSQILIVIGEERSRLVAMFQNCYFTSGDGNHFVLLINQFIAAGESKRNGSNLVGDYGIIDDDSDLLDAHGGGGGDMDDFDNYHKGEGSSSSSSSGGASGDPLSRSNESDKYCDVLFKGMCYAALEIYGELLGELRSGGLSASLKSACSALTGTSIDGSKDGDILTLLFSQAFEELECLKAVVRQVFPSMTFHVDPLQSAPIGDKYTSSSRVGNPRSSVDYSSIPFADKDALLKLVLNLAIKVVR